MRLVYLLNMLSSLNKDIIIIIIILFYGLNYVNTRQYQLVYAITYANFNCSYLVTPSSFQVILIEMDEIIRAATWRGGYL